MISYDLKEEKNVKWEKGVDEYFDICMGNLISER